jgi:hypothetical protein
MAATLNFKFVANDKGLQKGINRSQKSLKGLGLTTGRVARGMSRAFAGMGLGLSVYALGASIRAVTRAAAEDAKSQRLLALQLRTTRNATDEQIASVEKLLNGWSRVTGVADDELRPAYAKLVRATGNTRSANKLLKIALDGSAASGKSLSSVTDVLSKAFNGNYTSLYKLAPQLKATKGGVDEYAASVKGAAAAAADPFAKASVAFQEIKESIGTALLPALTGLADWFTKNGPAIQKWIADFFDPNTAVGYQFAEFAKQLDLLFARFDPKGKNSLQGFFNVFNTLLIGTLQILTAIIVALNTIADLFDKNKYLNGSKEIYGPGVPFQSGNNQSNYITNKYQINVNSTNLTGADIVKSVKKYEQQTGLKYLNY